MPDNEDSHDAFFYDLEQDVVRKCLQVVSQGAQGSLVAWELRDPYNLQNKIVIDFRVSTHGSSQVLARIVPPRVTTAFPKQLAAMLLKMSEKFAPLMRR